MVFAIPGHIYGEFHQGCHQLIREGAILIDHPQQVIEDLALPTQWQSTHITAGKSGATYQSKCSRTFNLTHNQLDWTGQSLDGLAQQLHIDVGT